MRLCLCCMMVHVAMKHDDGDNADDDEYVCDEGVVVSDGVLFVGEVMVLWWRVVGVGTCNSADGGDGDHYGDDEYVWW